jgi:hypothetical protein
LRATQPRGLANERGVRFDEGRPGATAHRLDISLSVGDLRQDKKRHETSLLVA